MPSRSTKCVRMRENPPPSMCAARGAPGWNRAPCGRIRGYYTHYCRNKGLWPPCGSIVALMLTDWTKCVWMRANGSPCHRNACRLTNAQTTPCHPFFLQSWANLPVQGKNLPFRKHLKMFLKNNLRNPPFSRSIYRKLPFHLPQVPFHLPPNFFLQLGKTDNFGIA